MTSTNQEKEIIICSLILHTIFRLLKVLKYRNSFSMSALWPIGVGEPNGRAYSLCLLDYPNTTLANMHGIEFDAKYCILEHF